MATETHIKDGGTWRKAKRIYVKSGGVWRDCSKVYVKSGGVWRQTFSSYNMTAGATGAVVGYGSGFGTWDGTTANGATVSAIFDWVEVPESIDVFVVSLAGVWAQNKFASVRIVGDSLDTGNILTSSASFVASVNSTWTWGGHVGLVDGQTYEVTFT